MTTVRDGPKVWGVIPAAGMSRRMGFSKQAADVRGSTMASVVVRTLLNAEIAGVVVVTRSELVHSLALPSGDRVGVAINDDAESEMIDSVRMGCMWLMDRWAAPSKMLGDEEGTVNASSIGDGVMVIPADMPRVSGSTCGACMAAFTADPRRIVIATYQGRRGHPIVFPLALCDEATAQDGGLRMLPRAFPERMFLLESFDPGVTFDVDTPRDYSRL